MIFWHIIAMIEQTQQSEYSKQFILFPREIFMFLKLQFCTYGERKTTDAIIFAVNFFNNKSKLWNFS